MMTIEQLQGMLKEYHALSSANLSEGQMDRLLELTAQTHKQIVDLTIAANIPQTVHPEHGPLAPNGVGYLKYVCESNPMGFCLSVQTQIQTLVWNIRHDTTRKEGFGYTDDGVDADEICGIHHAMNIMDLSAIVKKANCLDKDMWPFFRVRSIKGESKHLTSFRQDLFRLTGIESPAGSYELGNAGGL